MAYVPIPKDLSNVKTKIMLNLTKRQLICFTFAALCGVPIFFATKDFLGSSNAVLIMMTAMFPFFMFAMYERNGQPLEVILKNYIEVNFKQPKQRPYMTDNFYNVLEKQHQLNKEVIAIAQHQELVSRQKKPRNQPSNPKSKNKTK